jgi:hypothetical protein
MNMRHFAFKCKRSLQIELLAMICCLFMAASVHAATYTVKAGGGNYTTIQACATAMAAGDTCTVFAGTYNENVSVSAGTAGNYKTMTVNTGDTVNVLSFTISSHVKINGFHIQNPSSPTKAPCVTVAAGGVTDYYITNNNLYACGTYMIREDSASNTTHGFIQGNTLSYSCSTSASPNVCTAMAINGDYHLIENNDISHVSDGPYVYGKHNVLRKNTFHDVTDADCGSNSGNCHIDFMQADANVVGGAQPAEFLLLENNTVLNMTVTGSFAGAGMHGGALLQAEACNGLCQNAIIRFHTAAHVSGGGTTDDNSGTNPPPQAWINVKSYNNDWVDFLIGITGAGNGVNGHDHGSFGWAHLNEIYQLPFASANQTNPYYCLNNASACSPSSSGNNLAFCTGGNCGAQLFGHSYGTGAFTSDPGNLYADPQFVNYAGNNFALAPGSPALNAGTFLTTVASGDSGSGTSLVVSDAGYFQDGSGIAGVNGDCIAVTTTTNHICITAVNYSTNTLTLKSSITRSAGDSIWLYSDSSGRQVLSGSAPNIGASVPNTGAPTPSVPTDLAGVVQ